MNILELSKFCISENMIDSLLINYTLQQPKNSQEMKKSGEEAQENLRTMIQDLETTLSEDVNQQQCDEAKQQIKRLIDCKDQMYEKLQELWKTCEVAEERHEILKNNLKKKMKQIRKLEKTVAAQQAHILSLEGKKDGKEREADEEILDIKGSKKDDDDAKGSGKRGLNASEVAQLEDVVESNYLMLLAAAAADDDDDFVLYTKKSVSPR